LSLQYINGAQWFANMRRQDDQYPGWTWRVLNVEDRVPDYVRYVEVPVALWRELTAGDKPIKNFVDPGMA
jgi:hypothetical protein